MFQQVAVLQVLPSVLARPVPGGPEPLITLAKCFSQAFGGGGGCAAVPFGFGSLGLLLLRIGVSFRDSFTKCCRASAARPNLMGIALI